MLRLTYIDIPAHWPTQVLDLVTIISFPCRPEYLTWLPSHKTCWDDSINNTVYIFCLYSVIYTGTQTLYTGPKSGKRMRVGRGVSSISLYKEPTLEKQWQRIILYNYLSPGRWWIYRWTHDAKWWMPQGSHFANRRNREHKTHGVVTLNRILRKTGQTWHQIEILVPDRDGWRNFVTCICPWEE